MIAPNKAKNKNTKISGIIFFQFVLIKSSGFFSSGTFKKK
jgi:hypothetical protein